MKKLIIALLCVVIAVVGVAVFFQAQKTGSSMEDILPEGAIVYLRLNDVAKNLEEMASMPFWKAIGSVNYDLLIQKNIIAPQHKVFFDLIRTQLSEAADNPMTKKLFGREVAFAVYPLEKDIDALVQEMKISNPQIIEEVLSGLVLATRVDPDVQIAELLSRSFSQYGANISQGQIEYKGETVRTITLSNVGVKFSFVRLKDILVFGIGEKAARMCIDAFKGSQPSLVKDPQFEEAGSKFLDPSAMVGFLDFEAFLELFKRQAQGLAALGADAPEDIKGQKQWEDALAKMSGLETLAFSFQLAPVIKMNNHVLIDPRKLDPQYAALYTCPSQINKTINFIPKEVLGYQWTNCFDLDYYWKEITREATQVERVTSKIIEFEQKIGFSIERDILPAFGDEIGGYLSDIILGGLFPIPKFLFFIEIADRNKAERLLEKLKEQPVAMLQEENYDGISLKYFALPLGQDVEPAYCFFGDYLLVSTSRKLLRDSIGASKNPSLSLPANPAFKEVNLGLMDKNRSVQFVRIGQVIERVKGIIGWSNAWVTARDRKAQAFRSGSERPLEEVKASILDKEAELQEMRDRVLPLEDKIWDLETKGEDIALQRTELNDLRDQIAAKEKDLADEHERKRQLENILQEIAKSAPDPALRESFLDEVVYPILESLKSVEAYGLRVTADKDGLESSLFLKVAE